MNSLCTLGRKTINQLRATFPLRHITFLIGQSTIRGWIFLMLYKRQSMWTPSLGFSHPAATLFLMMLGNPFPTNRAQGPAGLDPSRYGLRQESEDSLTKNKGQSQEFGTMAPTNNDSNHPLFRLLLGARRGLNRAHAGPQVLTNQPCAHGER